MQQKEPMHPQDMRNLVIFGVLSILLWFAYDHFLLQPQVEQAKRAKVAQEQVVLQAQESGVPLVTEVRPRSEVVSEGQRIKIDADAIFGSINLTGGRVDDISLKDYFKTLEKKENVNILSPTGSPHARYVEYGWVSADKNIAVPNSKTVWSVLSNDVLTTQNPVTIFWDNGQGVRFERKISLDENYGFSVSQRVTNNTGAAINLSPYSLISQRGIPEGYLGRYISHEGLVGHFDDELVEKNYKKIAKARTLKEVGNQGWIGITEKDWLTALVPKQNVETKYRLNFTPNSGKVDIAKSKYQVDIMGPALNVVPNSSSEYKSHFFSGAKELDLLIEHEKKWDVPHLDLAVDFGIFYFLTRPFFAVINFFYGIVGNFGLAIILFTVVLRIAVYPLANTSFKSFAKLRQVGPQMSELREEYKHDKQKLQEELVKLYSKEKVNPMAGCLPILVQIPIFFALFKVLSNTIEMRHAPFFGWIQDLSAPDPTSIFNAFGLIPWDPPMALMIGAWPCLMLITMLVQRSLSPPPTDPFQAKMIAFLPFFMTFILAKFAAGLVIYWTFNNLFSTIQQYIIMRRMGVEVDMFGNMFKKKQPEPIEGVHPEAAMIEEKIETALGVDQSDTPENDLKNREAKPISKPKPKKKKPTQKKKK